MGSEPTDARAFEARLAAAREAVVNGVADGRSRLQSMLPESMQAFLTSSSEESQPTLTLWSLFVSCTSGRSCSPHYLSLCMTTKAERAGLTPLSALVIAAARDPKRPGEGILLAPPPLSAAVFRAMSKLARRGELTAPSSLEGSVGFRVGSGGEWVVATCRAGLVASVLTGDDAIVCVARIVYADESTFVALMEDRLSPVAAVAMGRLRVDGSMSLAAASEPLFEQAEAELRATLRADKSTAAAAEAAERERVEREAAQMASRVEAALRRPAPARWLLRHTGTDQQLGALLLVLASATYVGYCALVLRASWPDDAVCNVAYVVSASLWLLGSWALVHASYPEQVQQIFVGAAADAADPSRLRSLSPLRAYATDSSLLVGAWGLGLGAPTFLGGTVSRALAHPDDPVAWAAPPTHTRDDASATSRPPRAAPLTPLALLPQPRKAAPRLVHRSGEPRPDAPRRYVYMVAGVYIFFATSLMVYGALPASLAANSGVGSDRVLQRLGGAALPGFWQTHLSTDLLAGTWCFAIFMVACLAFGAVDFALEPSFLTAFFLATQVPFVAGAVLLATAAYPNALNRSTVWGADAILDDLLARKLVGTSTPTTPPEAEPPTAPATPDHVVSARLAKPRSAELV